MIFSCKKLIFWKVSNPRGYFTRPLFILYTGSLNGCEASYSVKKISYVAVQQYYITFCQNRKDEKNIKCNVRDKNDVHHNLDFCALEICVFDFCGVPNYGLPLKFAGQNLDFCGKITQKSKILWKINSFFPTNRFFSLISLACFEFFYVQGLYVIKKKEIYYY